jgi:periplasmic divalent cation tolerance protein
MKKRQKNEYCIALVTVPSRAIGRRLARQCLKARLAACVNLVPDLESHYWWEGKLDTGRETLMLIKTRLALIESLEQLILKHHPYDTPEFIVIDIASGNARYLGWLASETMIPQ